MMALPSYRDWRGRMTSNNRIIKLSFAGALVALGAVLGISGFVFHAAAPGSTIRVWGLEFEMGFSPAEIAARERAEKEAVVIARFESALEGLIGQGFRVEFEDRHCGAVSVTSPADVKISFDSGQDSAIFHHRKSEDGTDRFFLNGEKTDIGHTAVSFEGLNDITYRLAMHLAACQELQRLAGRS